MRIYQPADWAKLAQDRISELTKSQIKYERNRAIKKGMGFEQWVESRLPVDPLPDLIDEFNRICDEEETLVVPNCSVNGSMITDPYRYEALADKASRIAEQIERHLADSGVPAEPG